MDRIDYRVENIVDNTRATIVEYEAMSRDHKKTNRRTVKCLSVMCGVAVLLALVLVLQHTY
jgi:hypothetical protein